MLGPARSFLAAGAFDPELNCSEDLDIVLKLIAAGTRIVTQRTDEPVATYIHHRFRLKAELIDKSQSVVRNRFRALARRHDLDIDKIFARRRLNHLFSTYMFEGNINKALALTLNELMNSKGGLDELAAKNLVSVISAVANGSEGVG